eukprot:CAMPEP_0170556618 /NCGR_PEP_ID=MMETSP0211-20121228/17782_1 /TAXON_ID=311385 /ORGANISM="Pseudokeronopsis sp., Strain OXSARD2" /LENGTH=41 /DNA_ID= /DNA_START= /DNA_END= /DNA_ORIENTATION=
MSPSSVRELIAGPLASMAVENSMLCTTLGYLMKLWPKPKKW